MSTTAAGERRSAQTRDVPTYCYNCVAGPDLLTVKVSDGVATASGPTSTASACTRPTGGPA